MLWWGGGEGGEPCALQTWKQGQNDRSWPYKLKIDISIG